MKHFIIKLKMLLSRYKWYLKGGHHCKQFCPNCQHFSQCVYDETFWERYDDLEY